MNNIQVHKTKVVEDGACNSCQRRDDPYVFMITLPYVSMRLCRICALATIQKLKQALK